MTDKVITVTGLDETGTWWQNYQGRVFYMRVDSEYVIYNVNDRNEHIKLASFAADKVVVTERIL